jgi:hypothetical protein
LKTCTQCGELKDLEEFYSKGHWCKGCHRDYRKDHYAKNRQYYLDKALRAKKVRREWYNELKNGPCTDCGVSYPPFVMHWDHLGDKEFDISAMLEKGSRAKILREIEKCELVCANCHAFRTHSRLQ